MLSNKIRRVEVTKNIYRALKLSLWAENLRTMIREKGKSLKKLSEDGNFIINRVSTYAPPKRKYSFQETVQYEKINTLKRFVQENYLSSLDRGQRENLCRMLEVWKWSDGRYPDGSGRGVEMSGHADINFVFPDRNIIHYCMGKGWVDKIDLRQEDEITPRWHYFLSREGLKLPKVKTALSIKDRSGRFQITSYEN